MYKICKSEQSAMRQRELENGLLDVMLNHNYEDISVSDLCDHLQIPRKSFYRYFANKDGAFYALLDHTLEACNHSIDPHASVEIAIAQYFSFWFSRSDLLTALERSCLSGKLVERTFDFAMREQGFVERLLRRFPGSEKTTIVMFLSTGLMAIVLNWHQSGYTQSIDHIAKTITRLLSEPIFPM